VGEEEREVGKERRGEQMRLVKRGGGRDGGRGWSDAR
jgi:hypothetical protein